MAKPAKKKIYQVRYTLEIKRVVDVVATSAEQAIKRAPDEAREDFQSTDLGDYFEECTSYELRGHLMARSRKDQPGKKLANIIIVADELLNQPGCRAEFRAVCENIFHELEAAQRAGASPEEQLNTVRRSMNDFNKAVAILRQFTE